MTVSTTWIVVVNGSEWAGDVWRLPNWRTPLFGTGYFAKKTGEGGEDELQRLSDDLRGIRHGVKKCFSVPLREAGEGGAGE